MPSVSMDDIKRLVELQLGKRNVNEADRLVEDLGAESADVANIVAAVEARYGIAIKESEIARLFTPQDLFELVKRKP
jgi:acyl carrier protein